MKVACFRTEHTPLVCGSLGIDLTLEDKERLKSWGRNGRKTALERFALEKAAELTLES